MNFNDRLEVARHSDCENKNCVGTALYIFGLIPEERLVSTTIESQPFLDKYFELIDAPVAHCLSVFKWYSDPDLITHMGVITDVNPELIACRVSTDGKFIGPSLLSNYLMTCNNFYVMESFIEYYKPIS